MTSRPVERPRAAPLTYTLFDPAPCEFPEPRVPLLPMFTFDALGGTQASRFRIVGGGLRGSKVYKRGRYALLDAYRLSGVGREGALLAPAYHCRTMLDAAISLGGELMLYELDEQLAPKLASLERLVKEARTPVRAMLLTHYFGFAQNVAPLESFCNVHGIALIEDCSHALFNLHGAERLGQHGRYTIASPYKLLPCEEGGLLIPGPGAAMPDRPNRPAGLRTDISLLATMLQRKRAHQRTKTLVADVSLLGQQIGVQSAAGIERGAESTASQAGTSSMYLKGEEGLAGSWIARRLMSLCNLDIAAERRRANYRRWAALTQSLHHCRPLFPVLPDDCVPYMFPLLIDHPENHFYMLKRLGMPIWRWDEMAVSGCPTAARFRQHLLHLPCHQALTEAELTWMHTAVAEVMRQVPGPQHEPVVRPARSAHA